MHCRHLSHLSGPHPFLLSFLSLFLLFILPAAHLLFPSQSISLQKNFALLPWHLLLWLSSNCSILTSLPPCSCFSSLLFLPGFCLFPLFLYWMFISCQNIFLLRLHNERSNGWPFYIQGAHLLFWGFVSDMLMGRSDICLFLRWRSWGIRYQEGNVCLRKCK